MSNNGNKNGKVVLVGVGSAAWCISVSQKLSARAPGFERGLQQAPMKENVTRTGFFIASAPGDLYWAKAAFSSAAPGEAFVDGLRRALATRWCQQERSGGCWTGTAALEALAGGVQALALAVNGRC